MADHIWNVYLAGEIHSDWRRKIIEGVRRHKLPIEFDGPVTDHTASDTCGEKIPGTASDSFWRDHRAANINAIRTSGLIRWADIVVVSFSEKYRQWNAAFDAGFSAGASADYADGYEDGYVDGAESGDVNLDGELNILDLVTSANMILDGE